MAPSRVEEIIRHFRENGLKLLLEHPANARELFALTAPGLLGRLTQLPGNRAALLGGQVFDLCGHVLLRLGGRQ